MKIELSCDCRVTWKQRMNEKKNELGSHKTCICETKSQNSKQPDVYKFLNCKSRNRIRAEIVSFVRFFSAPMSLVMI